MNRWPFRVIDGDGEEIASAKDQATADQIARSYNGVVTRECDDCGEFKPDCEVQSNGDHVCYRCSSIENDPVADLGDWRYHQRIGA